MEDMAATGAVMPTMKYCIYCSGPVEFTVPHIVRDCPRFNDSDVRMAVWISAWELARQRLGERLGQSALYGVYAPVQTLSAVTADVADIELNAPRPAANHVRDQWYALTIGEEVDAAFLPIGLEGWRATRATPTRNVCPANGGATLRSTAGLGISSRDNPHSRVNEEVYAALLNVTGALLKAIVDAVKADVAEWLVAHRRYGGHTVSV
jgi:hypothetical protein